MISFLHTIKMVQLAFTGLVGLIAALQPALAAPQRNIGASDSSTCIADGKLYRSGRSYRVNNTKYVVRCAKDSSGDAQSVQKVSRGGFAACFDICERTKDCAGFTYSGSGDAGNCYLKNKVGGDTSTSDDLVTCHKDPKGPPGEQPEPVPSSSTNRASPAPSTTAVTSPIAYTTTTLKSSEVHTSLLTPTPSSLSQCQEAVKTYGNVYRGASGSPYQLSCGTDHYGGDLSSEGSDSFLGCVDKCDKNKDCIGYAYIPGNCFLKNILKPTEANPGVDFALNLDRNSTAKPPVTTSSAGTSSADATTSSSAVSTPSHAPGSCPLASVNGGSTFTNTNGVLYTIECGSDHNGGDLVRLDGKTFTDCSLTCDKTDKCIAYAWVGGNGPGSCYLKSSITGRESNSGVDYAYKKAATYLPSSSAPVSPSTSFASPVPVTSSSSVAPPPYTPPRYTPRTTWTETKTVPTTSAAPPPTSTPRPTWTTTKSIPTTTSVPPPPPPPPPPKTSSTSGTTVTETFTHTRPHYHHNKSDKESSTATQYVSKTYTQTDYVSSTGSSKPAPPTTTVSPSTSSPKPVETTTHTHTHTRPTKTKDHHHGPDKTAHPARPAPVHNPGWCSKLRDSRKVENIRIHIVSGRHAAHGQWIRDPARDGKHAPTFCTQQNEAAAISYNGDAKTVVAWQDREGCGFAGLAVFAGERDKDHHDGRKKEDGRPKKHREGRPKKYDRVEDEREYSRGSKGEVVFADDEASGGMVQRGGEIVWEHERFGGWLVCGGRRDGGYRLNFWDKGEKDRVVPRGCAVAQLRVE